MGMSPSSFLAYGFQLPEDFDMGDHDDIQDFIEEKLGIQNLTYEERKKAMSEALGDFAHSSNGYDYEQRFIVRKYESAYDWGTTEIHPSFFQTTQEDLRVLAEVRLFLGLSPDDSPIRWILSCNYN